MPSISPRPGIDVAVDDPYPWYESLRERTPVLRVEDDLWLISRYADVAAAGRDVREILVVVRQ